MQAGKSHLQHVRLEYLPSDMRCRRIDGRGRPLLRRKLHIAAIGPGAPVFQTVKSGRENQFIVRTGIVRKILVHRHYAERPGVIPHRKADFLPQGGLIPEQLLSPAGRDQGRPRHSITGSVPADYLERKYPQQVMLRISHPQAHSRTVRTRLIEKPRFPFDILVHAHRPGLRKRSLQVLYHRPRHRRIPHPRIGRQHALQAVDLLMLRITPVIPQVIEHLHHHRHENRESEGQSRHIEDRRKKSVPVEAYASHIPSVCVSYSFSV